MAQRLKHLPGMQETGVRSLSWEDLETLEKETERSGDPGEGNGKIWRPWRRKWQPSPVLLPGESHGGRSLVGYSPRGRKELDTTEQLHFHFH